MKTYGGFKLIKAQPMSVSEAKEKGYKTGDSLPHEDGYEVEYEDGYRSWSPEKVFVKAYSEMSRMRAGWPEEMREMLSYFKWDHLPEHLQEVSAPFAALAWRTAQQWTGRCQTIEALKLLVQAKDATVRAALR